MRNIIHDIIYVRFKFIIMRKTALCNNFRIDNLVIIPEVRWENASKEIYTKSNGTGTKSNGSFLVAAFYKF